MTQILESGLHDGQSSTEKISYIDSYYLMTSSFSANYYAGSELKLINITPEGYKLVGLAGVEEDFQIGVSSNGSFYIKTKRNSLSIYYIYPKELYDRSSTYGILIEFHLGSFLKNNILENIFKVNILDGALSKNSFEVQMKSHVIFIAFILILGTLSVILSVSLMVARFIKKFALMHAQLRRTKRGLSRLDGMLKEYQTRQTQLKHHNKILTHVYDQICLSLKAALRSLKDYKEHFEDDLSSTQHETLHEIITAMKDNLQKMSSRCFIEQSIQSETLINLSKKALELCKFDFDFKNVELDISTKNDTTFLVNPNKFLLILCSALLYSLRNTPSGKIVTVSLDVDERYAYITIYDQGYPSEYSDMTAGIGDWRMLDMRLIQTMLHEEGGSVNIEYHENGNIYKYKMMLSEPHESIENSKIIKIY